MDAFDATSKSLRLSKTNRDTGIVEHVRVFVDASWLDEFDEQAMKAELQKSMLQPLPDQLDYRPAGT